MKLSGIIVGGFVALAGWLAFMRGTTMSESAQPAAGSSRMFSTRVLTARQTEMADMIVKAARANGLNPAFMVALAVTESSLDPSAVGDDGISIGLFQLNTRFRGEPKAVLLDGAHNADAAMQMMRGLIDGYPGFTYGDYAEAWTLGGAGRFRKGRRNPQKLTDMEEAIRDLSLNLSLREKP